MRRISLFVFIGNKFDAGCFKSSFTNLRWYIHLLTNGRLIPNTQKCSQTHQVLSDLPELKVRCDFEMQHNKYSTCNEFLNNWKFMIYGQEVQAQSQKACFVKPGMKFIAGEMFVVLRLDDISNCNSDTSDETWCVLLHFSVFGFYLIVFCQRCKATFETFCVRSDAVYLELHVTDVCEGIASHLSAEIVMNSSRHNFPVILML
jgi:hypothetical protein